MPRSEERLVPRRLKDLAKLLSWGPPCCKLTASGKHQLDCPRALLATYEEALTKIVALDGRKLRGGLAASIAREALQTQEET